MTYTDDTELLRSILESAVEGIIVIDAKGLVQAFNPAAERLFGYAADELLGQNVKLLMPSPDHEQHDAYLHNYIATGQAKIIGKGRRVRGQRKDGTTFPLHLSVGEMSLRGARAFTGILHDLTEREVVETALRKSEERLRSIVESAVDGIIVIDERAIVHSFNPAAERLFGYSADEVIGRNVKMLMPNPDRDRHDTYVSSYIATKRRKIIGIGREVRGRRKDGTTFPLHLSVGEMKIENQTLFTGILQDLTYRVDLEQRLAEQKSLAKLGEMAAVVAHEVKNPIAGIRGALQVITSRMPVEQRDRGVLLDIITRLDGLDRIVQDMLMFARPRALQLQRVPVAALISDTADLIQRDPTMAALDISVRGDAALSADLEMLRVVFQNILMNAAQAMGGQGRIDVTVAEHGANCRVQITDQGPGMPAEVREKAFDAFFTTKHRGTGLGLPIARRVIDAHGGTIDIDVPPGNGTTVSITLPTQR
jgi:PAS domain S-box-containing protein